MEFTIAGKSVNGLEVQLASVSSLGISGLGYARPAPHG